MMKPFIEYLDENGERSEELLAEQETATFFPRDEPYEEDDSYLDTRTGTRWLTMPARCDVSDSLVEIFSSSLVSCSKDGCNICVPSFHWNLMHPECDPSTVTIYCCKTHCERFQRIQFCFAGKVADVWGMQRLYTAFEDTLTQLASKWRVESLRLKHNFVEDGVNELEEDAESEISVAIPRYVTLRTHLSADTIARVLRTIRGATESLLAQPNRIAKVVFAEADVSGDTMEFIYYSLLTEPPAERADSVLEHNRGVLRIALLNVFGEPGCGVIFGSNPELAKERDAFFEWVNATFPVDAKPTVADRAYRKGDVISSAVRALPAQVKPFPRGTETRDSLFGRLKDVSNVRDGRATCNIAKGAKLVEPGDLWDSRPWLGAFYYNMEVGSLNDAFTREYFEEQHELFPDAYPVGKRQFNAYTKFLARNEATEAEKSAAPLPTEAEAEEPATKKRSRSAQPRAKGGKKKVASDAEAVAPVALAAPPAPLPTEAEAVFVAPVASVPLPTEAEAVFIAPVASVPLPTEAEAVFVAPVAPAAIPEALVAMFAKLDAAFEAEPAPKKPRHIVPETPDEFDLSTAAAIYDDEEEEEAVAPVFPHTPLPVPAVCPRCNYKECDQTTCNASRFSQHLYVNQNSLTCQ